MRLFLPVLFLLCLAGSARAMTIEEAYQSIPHQRTVFDSEQAKIPKEDAAYLKQFFALTDEALRDRVETMIRLSSGKDGIAIEEYNERYAHTVKALAALSAPDAAAPAQKLIVEAIGEQADFLNGWAGASAEKKAHIGENYRNDPLVQSSHQKLVQGYMLLMSAYSAEGGQNKQAFYDYLCALDFM